MKALFLCCSMMAVSLLAQAPSPVVTAGGRDSQPHSNLHPPQEDWARLGFYASDNARLAKETRHQPRVVFLGDSITFHWQDAKYTSFFQEHPNFVNRGIPGNNTAQMLLRYRSDVLALDPKVVVVFGGTNDLAAFKLPDIVAFTEQSISSIVELAQFHHERVVLCSVTPVTDAIRPQTTVRNPADILRLNAWIKSFATQKHIPYVDLYAALNDGHDQLRTELTIDGLHPNGEGYKRMEPVLLPEIERELRAK
jgi:lysophospholipase L1-like esterase